MSHLQIYELHVSANCQWQAKYQRYHLQPFIKYARRDGHLKNKQSRVCTHEESCQSVHACRHLHRGCAHMANIVIVPLNSPRQNWNTTEDHLEGKRKHFKMDKMVQESGNSVHVLESRINRERLKDSCQNFSLLHWEEKEHVQTIPARELRPNKARLAQLPGATAACPTCILAHENSSQVQADPSAYKKHRHGQRDLLDY